MDLQEMFISLFFKYVSKESDLTRLWNELEEAYQEDFRKYHNLNHLEELFRYYEIYKSALKHPEEIALAIFYHDYVYNIWKKDNEDKSAIKATQVLKSIRYSIESIHRIEQLILATKHHNGASKDEKFLIDFDLAIIGKSEEEYKQYAINIRKEYAKVPSFMYRKGRKKVLQHFLDKKSIFQTTEFISKYEEQARRNLRTELNQL